jgi:hypothetical protein
MFHCPRCEHLHALDAPRALKTAAKPIQRPLCKKIELTRTLRSEQGLSDLKRAGQRRDSRCWFSLALGNFLNNSFSGFFVTAFFSGFSWFNFF